MTRTSTQSERLTRIETLLEADLANRADERQTMREKLEEMAADIKAIRSDLDGDKAELAALKNKGAGLLIGVGLAGGAIGAGLTGLAEKLFG